ncbi:MAG: phenylalanine--tRNA ligase subunit alpha [Candidatus Hodarchaeota archaeon]
MNTKSISISPEMASVLQYLKATGSISIDDLAEAMNIQRGKIELITSRLSKEKLTVSRTKPVLRAKLTAEGKKVLKEGLPENRIVEFLTNFPDGIQLNQISSTLGLSKQAVNAGIGNLRKTGLIEISKGNVKSIKAGKILNPELETALRKLSKNPLIKLTKKVSNQLSQRGFIELKERQQTVVEITKTGTELLPNIQIIETISKLTPDHIRSGKWRELKLKSYNITARPKSIPTGRKHPYVEFLEEVKLKLIGLGFSERRGPLVESEFWNFDALFQAQDHPAREWSDVYMIENPSHGTLPKDQELIERVQKVHETGEPVGSRGWRYRWDPQKAARLILRPQGTAVSARTLYQMKIPAKYFCMARVYRPDSVDATHLSEFNQMEGIACDPSITFRDLLGILKTFATEVAGATKVRFKPDYFPFTSPSVELSALHPELGFIEFGGSGIFRPEVTAPFGIKVTEPVIAWGLGIDRLFMVKRGINDIRELFTHNLNWLRTVPLT